MGTLRGQRLAGGQAVDPLLTLLVGAGQAVALGRGAAEGARVAGTGLGVEQTQGLAGGRQGQRGVQEQAEGFVAVVADGSEALGLILVRFQDETNDDRKAPISTRIQSAHASHFESELE